MATEVLRPHDVLLQAPHAQRIRAAHRRANFPGAAAAKKAAAGSRGSSAAKKAAARHAAPVYAGPAYSVSPEPSKLPLPQFTAPRKAAAVEGGVEDAVDAATRDLRRMLRLE